MSGQQYHLKVINESNREWTFYVYQKAPIIDNENIFSLAWFASPYKVRVDNYVEFYWSIDYEFVWSASGTLKPGVVFRTGGSKACQPGGNNHTEFSAPQGGAPGLSEPFKGPKEGILYIKDDSNVPVGTFSVGIGMSGNGTFVQQADANLTHKFTPTPSYWVAAGDQIKVGTVLDIQTVTKTAEVKFQRGVYSMVAILTDDNTWEIKRANAADTNVAAGGSTETKTTNTRTTTTYNCCALI